MAQLVERATEFITALHVPVVLVGHSMGALESMYLAGDLPDLVRAIVLEDPPMAQDLSQWRDAALFEGLFGFLSSMRAQGFASAVARAREEKARWDDIEYEPWVRSKQVADAGIRNNFAIHREAMEATLARIHCPVLLLTGNPARGAIVEPGTAGWAQERCPTLTVQNFPTASHDVRRDQADAVAPLVRAFIARHSA
jgi:pimeloyl-ACP methyl ester carboxylesterase